jgi:excinuclease ABC subunit A
VGRAVKWDRTLLPQVLKVLCEVEPSLEWKWDVRDAVTIRPKGSPRMWARIKTKESKTLECWFIGQPGQFNLSRLDGIGQDTELETDRFDGSNVLKLHFARADQVQPAKLKPILAEHLKGFLATFA